MAIVWVLLILAVIPLLRFSVYWFGFEKRPVAGTVQVRTKLLAFATSLLFFPAAYFLGIIVEVSSHALPPLPTFVYVFVGSTILSFIVPALLRSKGVAWSHSYPVEFLANILTISYIALSFYFAFEAYPLDWK